MQSPGWQEAVCVLPGGPQDWARRARKGAPISHLPSNTYVWRFALNLKTLIDSRRYGAGSACSICRRISELTQSRYGLLDEGQIVAHWNRAMLAWANYVYLGQIPPAYRVIDTYATKRLRQRLCRKHRDAHWEVRALLGRATMKRHWTHAPDSADGQPCVGEGMISNGSPVREIRTLGSTSGEGNRSRS